MRICSVSVDLDPLSCYYKIHGLGEPPPVLRDVILRRGLARFLDVLGRRGIHATFFVVGADLDGDTASQSRLAAAAKAGHELANHSYGHLYNLARLSRPEIDGEVKRAHDLIGAVAGTPPVGFRSPGYDMSGILHDVLCERGYRYDSSVFPSWPYYLAKAAVMGGMALVGRKSRSVMVDPRTLFAPSDPYRPGRSPFSRGQSTLVELPITTSPGLRLPTIGTYLMASPTWVRSRLLESVRSRPFFNLELHGIDLIGADEDGIPSSLVARQADLRVSLDHKLRAFEATLDRLAQDYRFATLRDVAAEFQREGTLSAA